MNVQLSNFSPLDTFDPPMPLEIHFVELFLQSPRLMLSGNLAALRDSARALDAGLHPAARPYER